MYIFTETSHVEAGTFVPLSKKYPLYRGLSMMDAITGEANG